MFNYRGKEYQNRETILSIINIEASNLKIQHRQLELSRINSEISRLTIQRAEIQTNGEVIRLAHIKEEEAKIANQTYQFVSTGFFIEGNIEVLTDTEMIMKYPNTRNCSVAYEIIKSGTTIFTKPKPINIKRRYDTLNGYEIIGLGESYLILKSNQNVILASSDIRNGVVRNYMNMSNTYYKIEHLKDAIIPLEEDKTFVNKWLMKNTRSN